MVGHNNPFVTHVDNPFITGRKKLIRARPYRGWLNSWTGYPLSPASGRERDDAPRSRRNAEMGRVDGGARVPAPVRALVLLSRHKGKKGSHDFFMG